MKKVPFLSLLLLPFLGGLSACEECLSPTSLSFGKLYDSSLDSEGGLPSFREHAISLDYPGLAQKINREESFLLLVYEENNSCTCWLTYQKTLLKAMKEENLLIYGIDMKEFGGGRDIYGIEMASGEETIVLFERGSRKEQRITQGVDDPFVEYDNFAKWLEKRIQPSSMLYINKEQLEGFKTSKADPYLIYFAREGCSDCNYIDGHFLYEWNEERHRESYILECDAVGIRYDTEEDLEMGKVSPCWQTFKDEYGLSALYNTDLGYDEGYVPSFLVYNPGEAERFADLVYDMAVCFNDALSKEGDEYKVTATYYTKARMEKSNYFQSRLDDALLGITVPGSEVDSNGNWLKEKALERHKPLLEGFLDSYLKLS